MREGISPLRRRFASPSVEMTAIWGASLVGEGGELVGDAEEEDRADDEAVGDGEGGGDGLKAGEVGAGGEDAAGRGGHEGVHGEQAAHEAEQTEQALRGAAELGGEEEEEELRGGFSAEAVEDADEEDGGVGVVEAEGVGAGCVGIEAAADLPAAILRAGDEESNAAAGWQGGVGVAVRGDATVAEPGDGDVDREDDEGGADEALADAVEAGRDGEVEGDDTDAEGGDGEGVAEGVEQAEAHAFAPVALDAGDVGDGGEVVVVKAMAQAEQGAGEESELEGVRHTQSKGTVWG